MLTPEQDKWIDRFSQLIADNETDTPFLRFLVDRCGPDFTFVAYHAGHTPAMACGILILAAKRYAVRGGQ